MDALESPGLGAAENLLDELLPNLALGHRTLLLIGRCRVDYEGRASSRLGDGDRLVILKPDGSLLIHNPSGVKPVNWQPPGCEFGYRHERDRLVLVARRRKPDEVVQISFSSLSLVAAPRLEALAPLELTGTEFDIRDTLRAQPSLVEEGFRPWARERVTERGPVDLYGEDARGRRVIVEVKRTRAGLAEATQLWRYVEKERRKRDVDVRGILVAPDCSARARALLQDHRLEFKTVRWEAVRGAAERSVRRPQPDLRSFASLGASPVQTTKT